MAPARQSSGRIDSLDGLRGFALLLVLCSHASRQRWLPERLHGADQIGVMLFFALSGFLMVYHYWPLERGLRRWLSFLTMRFFRLYLPFVAVILVYGALEVLGERHVPRHLTLMAGWRHLWAMAMEMRFYLLFPLLGFVFALLPASPRIRGIIIFLGWLELCFFDLHGRKITLWRYLAFFMAGMLAGHLHMSQPQKKPGNGWSLLLFACLACIGGIVMTMCNPHSFTRLTEIWQPSWLLSALVACTVLSCARSVNPARLLFANSALRFAGVISYSAYLIHRLVFMFVRDNFHDVSREMRCMIAFLFITALASLLYALGERPLRLLGSRLATKWFGSA
jgi:peptidoglycan/LPS O-acetylase OafA/YrhL